MLASYATAIVRDSVARCLKRQPLQLECGGVLKRNNRPATADTVQCPMCAGHGTLERAELVSRLNDREFNRILQNYIDEVTYGAMQPRDMLAADTMVSTHFGIDEARAAAIGQSSQTAAKSIVDIKN